MYIIYLIYTVYLLNIKNMRYNIKNASEEYPRG